MNAHVTWALLVQGVLPLGVILLIAFGPDRSKASWLAQGLSAAAFLTMVGLAGLWLVLPWYTPWVMVGLLLVSMTWSVRRTHSRWPASVSGRVGLATTIVLGVTFATVSSYAVLGHRPFSGVVSITLTFPLRGGPYLVAAGGSNALVNPHLLTLGPAYRAHRGQSFGIDLVALGRWGSRDSGIASSDPSDYAIFGRPVNAPCDGTVVRAFDGAPDMPVPIRSRDPLEGNHVIIDCDGTWVVLAHLQSGSVQVSEGQTLSTGSPVARVGNSGQSDEPHLHIHAQTPGSLNHPLSGDPVPIRFGDRWPVRNQRISVEG